MPLQLAGGSADDFAARVRRLVGDVELSMYDDGVMRLASSTFGRCHLSSLVSPPSLVSPRRAKRPETVDDTLRLILQMSGETGFRQDGFAGTVRTAGFLIYDPTHFPVFDSPVPTDQILLQIPRASLPLHARHAFRRPLLFDAGAPGIPAILQTYLRSTYEHRHALDEGSRSRLARTFIQLTSDLLVAAEGEKYGDGEPAGLATLRVRVMSFIEINLSRNLGIQEIAGKMGCSPRYIYKAFDHLGMSPSRYIWSMRLERAREQLVSAGHEQSICEIAHGCGFNSYSHFSRSFRLKFGLSPREAWDQRGSHSSPPPDLGTATGRDREH